MTQESDNFEKQIKRIKELLEDSNSEIIWNDKIPDPDNPKQLRQIDITIKKDEKITFVECRIHKKVQNVQWIEELIGRKLSLEADKLIAVSASGFTEGAVKKAKKFGIFLRDLYTLTEEEIKYWGNNSVLRFGLYHYQNINLSLLFENQFKKQVDQTKVLKEINNNKVLFFLFSVLKKGLQKSGVTEKPAPIQLKLDFEPNHHTILNIPIAGIDIEAEVYADSLVYDTASAILYDVPDVEPKDRKVKIESFDFEGFEITKTMKNVSICIDMSSIKFPQNTQFNGRVIVNFEKEQNLKRIDLIALDQKEIVLKNGTFKIGFVKYA